MKNIFKITSHPRKARNEAFINELNTLEAKFLNDLIKLADKYGKDRDETVFIMTMVFTDMATEITFKEYEVK